MKRLSLLSAMIALTLTLLMCAVPAMAEPATQPDTIGSVKTVSGTAYMVRNDQRIPASIGDHLFKGDSLVTESASSLGVIFRDDTILSMGPGSTISIDEFMFDPAQDSVAFLATMGKGTAQFITGQMSKIAPENMRVETPLATIGIRGTRFLVKVD